MLVNHTEKDIIRQLGDGQYLIWKHRGETLAELVKRFRRLGLRYEGEKITYAGRLDPMAEGVVLLLCGNARFQKDALLGMSKVYEVEVLLGVSTDTLDVLGEISELAPQTRTSEQIEVVVLRMAEIKELPYPAYASALVDGEPLYVHARLGRKVQVPLKKVEIHEAKLLHVRNAPLEMIAREAIADIGKVIGDFRQITAMKAWQRVISEKGKEEVTIATLCVTSSSGTYMRSLAEWLGKKLGAPAIAYKIKRIRLGEFEI